MKTMTIIAASLAAITLAGCIGDNSTSSINTNQTTQSTINSCFSLNPAPSISGSQWWVTGTVNLSNTCSSPQPLNGVVLTLANTSLTMNGTGFGMNNFTPYDSSNSLTFTNQNSAVVITINSNTNLAANASAQFSFGGTPGLAKAPPANSFTVYLGAPTGEPTPTASPTPTAIPTIIPTPLPLPTSSVTTTGKIYYHFYLPAGNLNGDHMVLDGDNYTDLIISNIIAGTLLARMVDETYPGIKYNQDYMIGSIWAQLLQENIDSAQYSHLSDDITPNGGAVMAGGQGGPYQLNNYAVDLIGQGAGRAMANYVAIQANIGYPLSSPLTAVTPPIFNNKYLGPILTAYFHINDLIVIHLLGDGSLGYISTPVPDYIQCLEVSKTLPDSPFEVQMNYAYNAGFYAGLNQAAASMCVSNPSKYNQVYNDYANAAGSSYNQYPYQVRFYLDEMFNRAPGIASLNDHIAFKTSQMRTIFAKVISKMAYTDKLGNYYPFTEAQANTAFDSALAAYSIPVATTFDFSDANHRPSIYKILYGAFLNLENSTGFLFNTATKNQLILQPAPTPSPTPTTTPEPSPTPSATPSTQPTVSPSPSPVPSPTPSVVPSPSPSPVPTVSPSPVPTQSPTPAPAKTGTVTITMPTVVSAYNGNLQVQLLNSKDSNAVVATYTVKQGASVSSGNLPISDSTHAYKVKLVSGIADPLNGVNYIESGTPTVAVKNGQNTAMTIPMKASTTTLRTVTLAISGLQGSDKANISFSDANGKYSYTGYSGYGNGNAVFKIENNQSLTITVATAGGSYQSSSLSNSSTISKNQTIAMAFTAKVQPSPSPVPTVAPSPSPVPSPSPSVVPSPSPSPIASPTPAPSPSPSGVQCSSYPTWNSSTAYNGGNMVSYSGYVYKANWWTKGNNPSTNNGGPGSGEEWLKIQACQ